MSHLSNAFRSHDALVCYITAGYPTKERSVEYILACVDGGADVIEIGVPFTDPVADGPIIQVTSKKALENGMTPRKVFDVVRESKNGQTSLSY